MQKRTNIINALTVCYFVLAFFEVLAEYFVSRPVICTLKPILPLFLILLYYIESDNRDKVFVVALLLSSVTNILFIPDTPQYLFYGVLIFSVHRILVLYLIFMHQKVKDYVPIIIATAPFLLVFFYLFSETVEIPENSVWILIIQNLLISLFAGIALSSYVMNDNKQNSILLISALLFVMLQFVVFIEKYFLIDEFEELFRPLAMTLNALAFFSFYKYVVTGEKSNNNGFS
ncbi:lysoplasmalogenase family protein [Flavobacterium wongokense]|uniref:lysoplasmalogenase family protein n=1 Tax=Flavobacterium wongokense TaxID=2910674 RepID=UPI001F3DA319|nr:lysoplasmalogenase family protein [Flavobacterium sp. WG47]MCF6132067.1 lysoplasmalogenase family protein [Flavobacterium sp. WG47]